jgi:hypothetical protein
MSDHFQLTSPRVELSEAEVIDQCKRTLRQRGYWLKRNHAGLFLTPQGDWITMGPPGIMDYVAVHETWPAFFVEFKRKSKVLRGNQQITFEKVQFGYRLAAVMVESAEALIDFINGHESRARRRVLQSIPPP